MQGRVLVEFWVELNGTVSNVKIKRGLLKSMDEEAVRVISLSPLWVPATKFGIPLRTHQTVAVDFIDF
jgi:TonB family protein